MKILPSINQYSFVRTNKGNLLVSEIHDRIFSGEKIKALSYNTKYKCLEFKNICAINKFDIKSNYDLFTLELQNTQMFVCTPDIKIFEAKKQQFIPASDISGDNLILSSWLEEIEISFTRISRYSIVTYSLMVKDNNNYFANDILVR